MKKCSPIARVRHSFARIHLVDKCLLLFMIVLLAQSGYVLFTPRLIVSDASHIDVMVRTASAAIFGYFLSANFIRHAAAEEDLPPLSAPPRRLDGDTAVSAATPRSQVGFAVSDAAPDDIAQPPATAGDEEEFVSAGRLQVLVAAGIGLFSLILLLFVRNFSGVFAEAVPSDSAVATVAQLRDFISGCVGFLIGSPTGNLSRAK